MMKIRQENDMIDGIYIVYAKSETKLPWSIGLGMICDENQTRQQRD